MKSQARSVRSFFFARVFRRVDAPDLGVELGGADALTGGFPILRREREVVVPGPIGQDADDLYWSGVNMTC